MLRRFFKKMNAETGMEGEYDLASETSQSVSQSSAINNIDAGGAATTLVVTTSLSGSSHTRSFDATAQETIFSETASPEALPSQPANLHSLFRVEELKPFDTCIEACDDLASASAPSGRVDPVTGLVDCSVLVSADGELLIMPRSQHPSTTTTSSTTSTTTTTTTADKENQQSDCHTKYARMQQILKQTAKELGSEYESSIFHGNDLDATGDKALNGFSSKGWSTTATTMAVQQSADLLKVVSNFCEDLILTKKSSAASENQMLNRLHPVLEGTETRNDGMPNHGGPLLFAGGTAKEALLALEHYYSSSAEMESRLWRTLAEASGPVAKLYQTQKLTELRAKNREDALAIMARNVKTMEEHLLACKEDSARKWDQVHDAEERITKILEEKMTERSRIREQQRLEQLKQDEAQRAMNAAHGTLGATSSEIWDIVSAVAASMEEGSFEPMDLPQIPLSAPRDMSQGEGPNSPFNETQQTDVMDAPFSVPIASRHELEDEVNLPELRAAAVAADEAVTDAANDLLHVLSNQDATHRSARLAADSCLVDACNAQAGCLQAIVKAERESLQERLKLLNDLEEVTQRINIRADLDQYITQEKGSGGGSFLGEDDDGGIAAALAVLNYHRDGNIFVGKSNSQLRDSGDGDGCGDDDVSVDFIEDALEKFFADNPLLRSDASSNEEAIKGQEQFEIVVSRLCSLGKGNSSSARSVRSTLCYALSSKHKVQPRIASEIQFAGLHRLFSSILSACSPDSSGVSLGKMLMSLSQSLHMLDAEGKEIFLKNRLVGHEFWKNDNFW